MRLISCYIRNFGICHDLKLDFEQGFQEFLYENGWGKSTVTAFIGVMLFGFENENVRKDAAVMSERERFRPWQGGSYGGSLTFEEKGVLYIANKTFHENRKNDEYELREASTNQISTAFPENIGTAVWGIDRESFNRTNCISGSDCETRTTENIRMKLANPSVPEQESARLSEAEEQCRNLLNEYSPSRKTGRLFKLKAKIEQLKLAIEHPAAAAENGQNEELRLILAQQRETELSEEDEEQLMTLNRRFAGRNPEENLDALLDAVKERRDLMNQLSDPDNQPENIDDFEDYDDDRDRGKAPSGGGAAFIVAAVLIMFGGVMLGMATSYWWFIAVGLGLLLFIFGLNSIVRRRKAEKNGDVVYNRGSMGKNISEKEGRKRSQRLEKMKSQAAQTEVELTEFLSSYGVKPRDGQEDLQLLELRSEWKEYTRLGRLASQHGKAVERLDDMMQRLKAELESCKAQQTQWQLFYDRIGKTAEFLREAGNVVNCRYHEPILSACREYLHMLLGDTDLDFRLDADLTFTIESMGIQRDPRVYSDGYKDLFGLCMRLALLEVMYPEDKPPVILDDPFSSLDADKIEQGMKLLENLSGRYQILYFTCHESRT